jgi:hypothetical protein
MNLNGDLYNMNTNLTSRVKMGHRAHESLNLGYN